MLEFLINDSNTTSEPFKGSKSKYKPAWNSSGYNVNPGMNEPDESLIFELKVVLDLKGYGL